MKTARFLRLTGSGLVLLLLPSLTLTRASSVATGGNVSLVSNSPGDGGGGTTGGGTVTAVVSTGFSIGGGVSGGGNVSVAGGLVGQVNRSTTTGGGGDTTNNAARQSLLRQIARLNRVIRKARMRKQTAKVKRLKRKIRILRARLRAL